MKENWNRVREAVRERGQEEAGRNSVKMLDGGRVEQQRKEKSWSLRYLDTLSYLVKTYR